MLLYKEFKNNEEFRNTILETVKTTVTDRQFREDQYWILADYILDEFSLAYSGITYNGTHYDMFVYPETDSTSNLIYDISQGKKFPKLHNKLPEVKGVMAVLR